MSHWMPWDSYPDGKIYGANMGPTWVPSAPDGPQPREPCYLLFLLGYVITLRYLMFTNGCTCGDCCHGCKNHVFWSILFVTRLRILWGIICYVYKFEFVSKYDRYLHAYHMPLHQTVADQKQTVIHKKRYWAHMHFCDQFLAKMHFYLVKFLDVSMTYDATNQALFGNVGYLCQ